MNELLSELDSQGVLTLTLNRPDKRNALNESLLSQLENAFIDAKHNAAIKVILLRGNGKAFCAGADISQLADINAITGYEFATRGQAVFTLLENCGKPSIAAIHGFAFGGGLELAMSAALRVCGYDARLGQPEVALGVIPGFGGTQRLTRLVGKGRALELCLCGQPIDAQTAKSWGLINLTAESEDLDKACQSLIDNLLKQSPQAQTAVLNSIHQGYDLPLNQALELEALYFAQTCDSEDKHTRVKAFLK